MAWKVVRSKSCVQCGFCETRVDCPADRHGCIGCGNCVKGCPADALRVVVVEDGGQEVGLRIDGEVYRAPARTSLGAALRDLGKGHDPRRDCGTGGCWDCGVLVDGELRRGCVTAVAEGLEVRTTSEALDSVAPRRMVSLFPNHLHASVSVFTHGCNFACDFCHNWDLAFSSAGRALTAEEAAALTHRLAGPKGNRRTGISGGEPTLNRRWLVEYVARLRALSPGVRIQLDTNASLLTPDYLDELWEAGVTDLSPDVKGIELPTFQKITGIAEAGLAASHLAAAWSAVEDAISRYEGRLQIAVAIPFHPSFIELDEVGRMGRRLAGLRRGLDVNLIVYQPAFRARFLRPAEDDVIDQAVDLLEEAGLTVWCQEGGDIPAAVSPESFGSESDEVF